MSRVTPKGQRELARGVPGDKVAAPLLAWFDRAGRKNLPWQQDRILKNYPLQHTVTTSDRQRAIVNSRRSEGESGDYRIH